MRDGHSGWPLECLCRRRGRDRRSAIAVLDNAPRPLRTENPALLSCRPNVYILRQALTFGARVSGAPVLD